MNTILREHFGCEEFQLYTSEEATGDSTSGDVIAGLMIHEYPEAIGAWRAKSGRYAKTKAAISAAEELSGIAPFEFRARYGCDCHLKRSKDGLEEAEWQKKVDVLAETVEDLML